MKALFRNDFKFHEVALDHDCNITREGSRIAESDLVYIIDDERRNVVVCSHCGAIMKNNKRIINAHKNRSCSTAACFQCGNLLRRATGETKEKFELNKDGTYTVKSTKAEKLSCRPSYRYSAVDINSEEARGRCKYRGCLTATYTQLHTFLIDNPDAFMELITVDAVIDINKGVRPLRNKEVAYQIPCRIKVEAVVNADNNLVTHFLITSRHSIYKVAYSKKLNKLFTFNYGSYRDFADDNRIAATTYTAICNAISKLYA